MKTIGMAALIASGVLYFAQIILYTKDQEILVYGALGMFWYSALYFNPTDKANLVGVALLSGLAAFCLGFVPHRLRLGGGFDIYIILFPVLHFVTTFLFLNARRRSFFSL